MDVTRAQYRASPVLAGLVACAASALGAALEAPLMAQDAPPPGLAGLAEVTLVVTSGNATARTLGVKSTLWYRWPESSVQLAVGAVRAQSGITTRVASGTPDDFTVRKETLTETTAESYFARARYDRSLGGATFLFGGAGWERNTFAGVDHRYAAVLGAGRAWADTEERRTKADLGLTYTVQDDVVEDPGTDDAFLGARLSVDLFRRLTPSTSLATLLVVDENLGETEDLRADWTSSISVAVSEDLALKVGYQVLFDHLPALTDVPLGTTTVSVPLDKVDSTLTLALVLDF